MADSDRVYINWSITNWITVFLMATLGFFLMGFVAQTARKMTGMNGGNGG